MLHFVQHDSLAGQGRILRLCLRMTGEMGQFDLFKELFDNVVVVRQYDFKWSGEHGSKYRV
jgi:hypothetical protein